MGRGDQLLRQWSILKSLQTRGEGVTLKQLCDEFEVSEKTMQRDIALLQELGFPVSHEADEIGRRYWRMPHDFFKTGPLVMSLTEAVSLHLADRLLKPLAGTHFAEGLQSILTKIRSQIPLRALDYFSGLDDTIHVRWTGKTDYADKADIVRLLTDATQNQASIELGYRSLWRRKQYMTLCDPYGLIFFDGDLFLVGHSHRANDVRVFKVSRIQSATGTDQTFHRPDDYRIDEHFRSSFGIVQSHAEPVEILVRFKGAVAALVDERMWHESQRLFWAQADDTLFDTDPEEAEALMAEFRLSNLVEFKRWLRGFGNMAEVLKPQSLRDEFREELLAAARQYE